MNPTRIFLIFPICILVTFISLSSCKSAKFNHSVLVGHWITVDPNHIPSMVVTEKEYGLILDSGEAEEGIDTFNFTYNLKRNLLTITQGSYWISKNRILKLTDDSLVFRRIGDKQIFRYSRKK